MNASRIGALAVVPDDDTFEGVLGEGGPWLVLFFDSTTSLGDDARRGFDELASPSRLSAAVIDVSRCPRAAHFFGLSVGPAAAVIEGMSMLAVTHDLSPAGMEELLRDASRQQQRLRAHAL
jgi:hypothetical protein